MFAFHIRHRWPKLMALRGQALPQPVARRPIQHDPAGRTEERRDPHVAGAYHQLGLVAQALEHWDAAKGWHVEALKAAAELEDHELLAKSAYQLAEACQRKGQLEDAVGWAAVSLAVMTTVSRRKQWLGVQNRDSSVKRVSLVMLESMWRGHTGEALPATVRELLRSRLEPASEDLVQAAVPTQPGRNGR